MSVRGGKYQKVPTPGEDVPMKYVPVNTNGEEEFIDSPAGEEHVNSGDHMDEDALLHTPYHTSRSPPWTKRELIVMMFSLVGLALGLSALGRAVILGRRDDCDRDDAGRSTGVPQYFQTTPELFAGPTATGRTPFLAAINPAPFGPSRSFVANAPLETALPIVGDSQNKSIFHLMGHLSPYFPNPSSFGIDEYSLPKGSNITQLHMLHRHGSRYPTTKDPLWTFGTELSSFINQGKANFTGSLGFLNSWSYGLGSEILVPNGRQELFDSGILHYYDYGHLYNTATNIIVRTTTQDRMVKSAEYFMAGFFGLGWIQNATLELILEQVGFNNSLAGYDNCNNSNKAVNHGGNNATKEWQSLYLQNATKRLQAMSGDFKWDTSKAYHAQTLCPYETVAYGYSAWCDLFTYEEWLGFEYAIDLWFAGAYYFQSPTGRAVGIGYVEELLARLNNHLLLTATAQDNITLDSSPETFPLNQTLYLDFSHDTNIAAVLAAFGLTQFASLLPAKGPIPSDRQLIISHLQPFAARLDIEIISAPSPVSTVRSHDRDDDYSEGGDTKYIHFLLNQRTLPLGKSFAECGERSDGWCELSTFLDTQKGSLAKAKYDESCNGDYPAVPYGTIEDGVPVT